MSTPIVAKGTIEGYPGQADGLEQEPLPEYTKAWGPNLHRPKKLPEHHDTRIDPAHIFVFTVHPITGIERDFFVTPKPCDYCAKVRQICSRTRPHCQRCAVAADNARACIVEEGWVRLPGPKCVKPKRKLPRDGAGGSKATKKLKKAMSSTAVHVQDAVVLQTPQPSGSESKLASSYNAALVVAIAQAKDPHKPSSALTQLATQASNKSDENVETTVSMLASEVIAPATLSIDSKSPPRVSARYGLRPHIRSTAKAT